MKYNKVYPDAVKTKVTSDGYLYTLTNVEEKDASKSVPRQYTGLTYTAKWPRPFMVWVGGRIWSIADNEAQAVSILRKPRKRHDNQ
jgi:hypothetical protein